MRNITFDKTLLESEYETFLLSEMLDKKYTRLFEFKNSKTINRLKRFKKILKDNGITEKLKDMIFADFDMLNDLKSKYGKKSLSTDDKNFIEKTLYQEVRSKFGYKLVELLDIKTCPYCNRNYIVNFNKKDTTVQLDHFYDKSSYFYLAISLYNLIPSCSTCNQRKSSKDDEILYPYIDNFDERTSFILEGLDGNDKLNFLHSKRIKLSLSQSDVKTENTKEIFNLDKLYQEHRDIVSEILKRQEIYPESRIDELYQEYGGRLFNSKDELLGLIHCNYIDKKDINKRPLSKLTKDILEQI